MAPKYNNKENLLRVFLVDDHPLYRSGVRALIEHSGNHIIWEFQTAFDACNSQLEIRPHVVFLDIELADNSGLTALSTLVDKDPKCQIYILSTHNQSIYIDHAKTGKASGYILKDDDPESILECLEHQHDDSFYLSQNCRTKRNASNLDQGSQRDISALSTREQEILFYLSHDLTSREIAEALMISFRTVQNHRANVKSKLGLTRNSELLKLALINKEFLENMFKALQPNILKH